MSNISIQDIKLIDLMPQSIRNDPQVIAACGAIQPELSELTNLIQFADIYGNIRGLPESILEAIIWENQLYGPEWVMAGTLKKRQDLAENGNINLIKYMKG